MNSVLQQNTARFKKLTTMDLITPIITVVVAITLQFPWDAEATGTQETLLSSTQCYKRAEKIMWRKIISINTTKLVLLESCKC